MDDVLIPLWIWGLILDGVGLGGSYLLSNKWKAGWIVSLVAQVLWSVYAVETKQWGFFPGILTQTVINIHGYRRWSRDEDDVDAK